MTKKELPRTVPTRDDYYMGLSFWIASKSKDPRTQVGAYIVGSNNEPLSFGYNGPPSKITDTSINWARPDKYPYIRHAEKNAIWYGRNKNLEAATLYVTSRPCRRCMLDIVETGISKVIYFEPKVVDESSLTSDVEDWTLSQEIGKLGSVTLNKFDGNLNWMRDRINWMESIGIFD